MKKQYTEETAEHVKFLLKPIKHPAYVNFIWAETKRNRDPDNIFSAKKFILDGMVDAGILPTDGQKWIKGFGKERIIIRDKPGVYVTIMEVISNAK